MFDLQPAYKVYLFEKGYLDTFLIIVGVWKRNWKTVLKYKNCLRNEVTSDATGISRFFRISMLGLKILSVLICGSIVTLFFSGITVLLYAISVGVYGVFLLTLWIIDRFYLLFHYRGQVCSKCGEKIGIPIFCCPECDIKHTNLVPGIYGGVKRRCRCGRKLPVTFWGGRKKLVVCCSHCGTEL